jgi:hypothetical protein
MVCYKTCLVWHAKTFSCVDVFLFLSYLTLYDVWREQQREEIQHDAYMSSRRSSERTASEERVNTIDVDAPPSTALIRL